MLSTLRNAWKVPELRKRLLYTLLILVFFRMGNFIPVPGVNTESLSSLTSSGNLFSFYDLLSGGAFSRFSIFAMGVTPYINASIIVQLLTFAIPTLEQMSKEGQEGRKKIQNITRYSAVVFGVIQAFGMYAIIQRSGALTDNTKLGLFLILITMTTGSVFLVWLGEQITAKGLGNGISLIIYVNIISRVPQSVYSIINLQKTGDANFIQVVTLVALVIAMLIGVIIVTLSERRIPVQYAGKAAGSRMFKGQSTHIPISPSSSAIIAIIFAMSVMQFPGTIATFIPESGFANFVLNSKWSVFRSNTWPYIVTYFILIVFFTWFYTQITFKPDEMAENMHKSSGFIPGIRPGEPTMKYIEKVLTRVSILGGVYAAAIALFPIFLSMYTNFKDLAFGGTAILIVVGFALETSKQIESQLVMRHYQGFLK
ncbi:protein translocase subunit secY/sec61 alpha [Clostridium collagenovorans DSM 3089]|uniref:Protein translocase subunit SecY n=1 Tax=Clostridium collagenovorans DSM 3089 TaxID=1121306 RepID=A0A1M5WAM5_9CLOT|nr:preprotein translocase subunit SecY [Clostridium collagenovorans]SHH84517.1 protein translocase subunit secY/sec61 alpha [Clostridium collagenovorans DSM 3089]